MTANLFDTTRARLLLRDILESKRLSPVQTTVKRAIDVIVLANKHKTVMEDKEMKFFRNHKISLSIIILVVCLLSAVFVTGSPRQTLATADAQQATGRFCGMHFAMGDDLATIQSLGATVVLQTFGHDDDPAEWQAQLNLAQSQGLQVIGQLWWPEGWEWDGDAWQIDDEARLFVQTMAAHPATFAVYALHEPYWRGCPTCGLTTAQQQALYQELKAIADVPLYSEIGGVAFWADQGEETTLADGVCDYCGVWNFPFYADGSYHREEFISQLDADLAAIHELAPNSKLVWLLQAFAQSDSPTPRRMPTAEEITDIGNIVSWKSVDGILWYVWEFGPIYDDFLSKHPELFPAVTETPLCGGSFKTYLPIIVR